MRANYPSAFFVSLLLHGSMVAIMLLFSYAVHQQVKDSPKVFEMVAGEGDNYAATEAPALGIPGGIKLAVPEVPVPPVETKPLPAPVVPAPASAPEPIPQAPPKKAAPKPVEKPVDFVKDVKRISTKRQTNLEKKFRAEKERKAREEAAKAKMTKEEFDRLNKNKSAPTTSGKPLKVVHVDPEGIRKGVVDGSTANKTGGVGGTALTRAEGEVLDAYISLLRQRLKAALEKPPGLSDTLMAVADVHLAADGTLSGARISESSGSAEFDQAVLSAIARTRMPARPDGKSETLSIPFRMRDETEN